VTAALGIVNTMVMAISERRKEISIIKSLGADERDIRRLFLVESAVIGAIGAVFGILTGWVATRIISVIAKSFMRREGMPEFELFDLPLWLILLAFAFGVVVSLLAGLFPASRAARVDPVAGLRNE
jgi:putative ABC transport system permease protein